MSLLAAIPQPRPCRLAGRVYFVHERTIGDIAYLESLALAARSPERRPWDRPDIEPAERRRLLRDAFNALVADDGTIGDGLPTWGDPETCVVVLGSEIGRREVLRRALRIPAGQGDDVIAELDTALLEHPEDWGALLEATGPMDDLAAIDAAILEEIGCKLPPAPETPDSKFGLRQAVAVACEKVGKAPHELADWTVSELLLVLTGGERQEFTRTCPDGWTRDEFEQKLLIPLQIFNDPDVKVERCECGRYLKRRETREACPWCHPAPDDVPSRSQWGASNSAASCQPAPRPGP